MVGRACAGDSFAMKPKSISRSSRHPEGLSFAWHRSERYLIRFWVALFLATLVTVAVCLAIRIVVPTSIASERPRGNKAQLLIVTDTSHSSLQELLTSQKVPSLSSEELIGEVPFVVDILMQLGLEEEVGQELNLFPASVSIPVLKWPKEEKRGPALPALSAPLEELWPQWSVGPVIPYSMTIVTKGLLAEDLVELSIPWTEALPMPKSSRWSFVFDERGDLVFLSAADHMDREVEGEIRKLLWQALEERQMTVNSLAEIVTVNFEKEG